MGDGNDAPNGTAATMLDSPSEKPPPPSGPAPALPPLPGKPPPPSVSSEAATTHGFVRGEDNSLNRPPVEPHNIIPRAAYEPGPDGYQPATHAAYEPEPEPPTNGTLDTKAAEPAPEAAPEPAPETVPNPDMEIEPPDMEIEKPYNKGDRIRVSEQVEDFGDKWGTLEKWLEGKQKWGILLENGKKIALEEEYFSSEKEHRSSKHSKSDKGKKKRKRSRSKSRGKDSYKQKRSRASDRRGERDRDRDPARNKDSRRSRERDRDRERKPKDRNTERPQGRTTDRPQRRNTDRPQARLTERRRERGDERERGRDAAPSKDVDGPRPGPTTTSGETPRVNQREPYRPDITPGLPRDPGFSNLDRIMAGSGDLVKSSDEQRRSTRETRTTTRSRSNDRDKQYRRRSRSPPRRGRWGDGGGRDAGRSDRRERSRDRFNRPGFGDEHRLRSEPVPNARGWNKSSGKRVNLDNFFEKPPSLHPMGESRDLTHEERRAERAQQKLQQKLRKIRKQLDREEEERKRKLMPTTDEEDSDDGLSLPASSSESASEEPAPKKKRKKKKKKTPRSLSRSPDDVPAE